MAKVVLRRRPRTQSVVRRPEAITAAATTITAPADMKTSVGSRDDWANKAWNYVRLVGELDYYVRWRSNACSRARLIAVAIDPVTNKPAPLPDDDPNAALISSIVRDIGGSNQPQILKRVAAGLTVPGIGYIALIIDDTLRERWIALSSKEINKSGQRLTFTLEDGTKHEFDPDKGEFIVKIWDPDPLEASKPTSPVRSNLPVLNEIVRATATIDNAASSRLLGQGLALIDDSVNLPKAPSAKADRPSQNDPEPQWVESSADDLQDLIYEVATTAVQDPSSMAALLPIFATVSGVKPSEAIHHEKFENTVPEVALKTRETAIRRLALGLDVSPERLLGMGMSSNHWSAWLITAEDVVLHVEPALEIITNALTQKVLRPALEVLGINPDLYAIGADVTELTQDPDRKTEALAAAKAGAISNRALRSYTGFPDEDGYDFDSIDGWIEWARDRVSGDPTQLPLLAPILALQAVQLPAIEAPTTPPTAPGPTVDAVPAQAEPGTEPAAAELLVTMCVRRALELAGRRMMTRTNLANIPAGTPPHEIHRHLLAPNSGQVFRLISGWDSIADDQLLASAGVNRQQFVRAVEARAVGILARGA